jgi:ABC-type oligopeptide transport system substrate-binding subunit
MNRGLRRLAVAVALSAAFFVRGMAFAQKSGGILKIYALDSPASMSTHEEAAPQAVVPMMGVFNNLVMFRQDVPQNSLQSILPDLATGWSWNEAGIELKFLLRQDVRWHDGKPFTARDVNGRGFEDPISHHERLLRKRVADAARTACHKARKLDCRSEPSYASGVRLVYYQPW